MFDSEASTFFSTSNPQALQPSTAPLLSLMDFTPDLVEIWTLYGIGTLMIASRIFVRTKMVGFRGYSPDDYLIWLAWLVYTNVTAMAHVFIAVAQGKHTSTLTPAQRENMPVSERPSWEFGSQIFLAGFFSYAIIVWTLKFNMLFFYRRLVRGTKVERAIIPALAFVGVTGVAVVLTFTLMCIPFQKLWQVYPDPKGACVPQNGVIFYTVLALNLITDLVIILIPIPVVLPMQTSILRKISLCLLFGLGFFVMICAIVRIVLVFRLNQQGVSAMWSIREDFVAVFVGQAPIVYSMTKPTFWRSLYGSGTHSTSANNTGRKNESYQMNGVSNKKPKDPYSVTQIGLTMIDKSESQEEIIKNDDSSSEAKDNEANGGIMVKRTYNVETRSDHGDGPGEHQGRNSRRTFYRDDST